jgi:hypothetical protein
LPFGEQFVLKGYSPTAQNKPNVMSHFHLEEITQNCTNASHSQHNKQATNTFIAISAKKKGNTATEIQVTVATN